MPAKKGSQLPRYVYDIPFTERRQLCLLLDTGGGWELLAGEVISSNDHISRLKMSFLRPGGSAADDLLTFWGHRNPTVSQLFRLLNRLHLERERDIIRHLVPEEVSNQIPRNNESATVTCSIPRGSYSNFSTSELPCPGDQRDDYVNCIPSSSPVVDPPPRWSQPSYQSERQNQPPYVGPPQQRHSQAVEDSDQSKPYYEHKIPSQDEPNEGKTEKDFDEDIEKMRQKLQNLGGFGTPNIREPLESQESCIENNLDKGSESLEKPRNIDARQVLPVPSCGPSRQGSQPSSFPNLSLDTSVSGSLASALTTTPAFSYQDLHVATRGFSEENVIGRGGFGVVYRGNLRKTTFAIKKLKQREGSEEKHRQQHYLTELETLLKYRHDNIVQLCGFSMDSPGPPVICLVYQFMVNGSLEDRLCCKDGSRPLTWEQRVNIAKGAARGVQYLHSMEERPLIHGDIKSANVLLDKHMEPKIGDFGLAKHARGGETAGKYTHVTVESDNGKVYGSLPYLPPEFFKNYQFSTKLDTYCFGVVLFEICTGEKASDEKREPRKYLKDYVHEVRDTCDPQNLVRLRDLRVSDWPEELFLEMLQLGFQCTMQWKKDRPEMTEVLKMLEDLENLVNKFKSLQFQSQVSSKSNVPSSASPNLSYGSSLSAYIPDKQASGRTQSPSQLHPGNGSPIPGSRSPIPGSRSPIPGSRSPIPGSRSPIPGSRSPMPGESGVYHQRADMDGGYRYAPMYNVGMHSQSFTGYPDPSRVSWGMGGMSPNIWPQGEGVNQQTWNDQRSISPNMYKSGSSLGEGMPNMYHSPLPHYSQNWAEEKGIDENRHSSVPVQNTAPLSADECHSTGSLPPGSLPPYLSQTPPQSMLLSPWQKQKLYEQQVTATLPRNTGQQKPPSNDSKNIKTIQEDAAKQSCDKASNKPKTCQNDTKDGELGKADVEKEYTADDERFLKYDKAKLGEIDIDQKQYQDKEKSQDLGKEVSGSCKPLSGASKEEAMERRPSPLEMQMGYDLKKKEASSLVSMGKDEVNTTDHREEPPSDHSDMGRSSGHDGPPSSASSKSSGKTLPFMNLFLEEIERQSNSSLPTEDDAPDMPQPSSTSIENGGPLPQGPPSNNYSPTAVLDWHRRNLMQVQQGYHGNQQDGSHLVEGQGREASFHGSRSSRKEPQEDTDA